MRKFREEVYEKSIYLADGVVILIVVGLYSLVIFYFMGKYFLEKWKRSTKEVFGRER